MAKSFADAFNEALLGAVNETTTKGLAEAQVMSQGPNSLGALAREDHPYAKRHGFPLRNPAIINEQTGKFLRDWKREDATAVSDSIEGSILNENPVADYLKDGTKFMFARPIDQVVSAKMEVFLEDALTRNLKAFEDTDFII